MYIDSPERKDIREGVKRAKERQADSVKKKTEKDRRGEERSFGSR
jgi:hypothetical protein